VPSHTVIEEWTGERVTTLDDPLRDGLRAVCIGINPSPVSVAVGHYYQSRAGQRFFGRLRRAGVLPDAGRGTEHDAAFMAGTEFTDIIKRPSANAKALPAAELEFRRQRLEAKLERYRPQIVIFVSGSLSAAGPRAATPAGLAPEVAGRVPPLPMPLPLPLSLSLSLPKMWLPGWPGPNRNGALSQLGRTVPYHVRTKGIKVRQLTRHDEIAHLVPRSLLGPRPVG
jgi:G:T/U-mismatch repair DNA glycosylase